MILGIKTFTGVSLPVQVKDLQVFALVRISFSKFTGEAFPCFGAMLVSLSQRVSGPTFIFPRVLPLLPSGAVHDSFPFSVPSSVLGEHVCARATSDSRLHRVSGPVPVSRFFFLLSCLLVSGFVFLYISLIVSCKRG